VTSGLGAAGRWLSAAPAPARAAERGDSGSLVSGALQGEVINVAKKAALIAGAYVDCSTRLTTSSTRVS
jgi:hypothetical protein